MYKRSVLEEREKKSKQMTTNRRLCGWMGG